MKLKQIYLCMLVCGITGGTGFSPLDAQPSQNASAKNSTNLISKATTTDSTGQKILHVLNKLSRKTKNEAFALHRTLERYGKEMVAHPFSWHSLYCLFLASHVASPISDMLQDKLGLIPGATYSKELSKFAQTELAEIDPVQAAKITVYVNNDPIPQCNALGTTIIISKGLVESGGLNAAILYHGCIALEKNKKKSSSLLAIASYTLPLAAVVAAEKYGVESSAKKLGLFVSVSVASAMPQVIQILRTQLTISPEEDARAKAFVNRKFTSATIPTN